MYDLGQIWTGMMMRLPVNHQTRGTVSIKNKKIKQSTLRIKMGIWMDVGSYL